MSWMPPINAIEDDALSLRREQDLNESQRLAIDDLALNCKYLSAIIGDVVEIARMDAADEDFAPAVFDLGDLIGGLRTDTVRTAAERGIGLELNNSAEDLRHGQWRSRFAAPGAGILAHQCDGRERTGLGTFRGLAAGR